MSIFTVNPFYHGSIKKLISGFGNVFTGITINEYDNECNVTKSIRVPIAYGPKNKWLARLNSEADLDSSHVKVTLPRIAFEITDYKFDATRKVGTQGSFIPAKIGGNAAKVFNPVPYDILIKLYTYAKDQDDSLKILEQILPYFSPILTLKIMQFPEIGMIKSIPIQLDGVSVDDNYSDMSTQTQRTVVQTFNFTAKMDLFGPIYSTDKVIKRTIIDVSTHDINTAETTYTAEVVPFNADLDDVYEIKEDWKI